MRPIKSACAALGAAALVAVPSVAVAHDGEHPFKNCSAAYAAGYANIPKGDVHYGAHLDRDKDGIGCDQPPKDFVPVEDKDDSGTTGGSTGSTTGEDEPASKPDTDSLAETGGNSTTPWIAAGGAAVILAGGAAVFAARRRRSTN